jgi:hypothetical protein
MHIKKWGERLTLPWRQLQLLRRRRLLGAQGLATKIYGEWLVIEGGKHKALGLSLRVLEKRKHKRKNRQRIRATAQLDPYYFYAPY